MEAKRMKLNLTKINPAKALAENYSASLSPVRTGSPLKMLTKSTQSINMKKRQHSTSHNLMKLRNAVKTVISQQKCEYSSQSDSSSEAIAVSPVDTISGLPSPTRLHVKNQSPTSPQKALPKYRQSIFEQFPPCTSVLNNIDSAIIDGENTLPGEQYMQNNPKSGHLIGNIHLSNIPLKRRSSVFFHQPPLSIQILKLNPANKDDGNNSPTQNTNKKASVPFYYKKYVQLLGIMSVLLTVGSIIGQQE